MTKTGKDICAETVPDIVERLRDWDGRWASEYSKPHRVRDLRDEAAAEIERQRAALANPKYVDANEALIEAQAEIERLRAALLWIDTFDPETTAAAEAKFGFNMGGWPRKALERKP